MVVGGGPAGLSPRDGWQPAESRRRCSRPAELGGRAASECPGRFRPQPRAARALRGRARRSGSCERWDRPTRWNRLRRLRVFRNGKARRTLGGEPSSARWLVRIARTDPEDLGGLSVAEWIGRSLKSGKARESAAALVRVATFVADHEAFSADAAATQLKTVLVPGVRYLRAVGSRWSTRSPIGPRRAARPCAPGPACAPSRATAVAGAVTLDEGTLHADALVIATGGPEAAEKLLGKEAPAAPGPVAELSVLDLGLESLPRRGRRFALGVDEPTYLSRHSPPAPSERCPAQPRQLRPATTAGLEALADTVQPGWRERVTLERFLPRMPAVSAIATPRAAGWPDGPPSSAGKASTSPATGSARRAGWSTRRSPAAPLPPRRPCAAQVSAPA